MDTLFKAVILVGVIAAGNLTFNYLMKNGINRPTLKKNWGSIRKAMPLFPLIFNLWLAKHNKKGRKTMKILSMTLHICLWLLCMWSRQHVTGNMWSSCGRPSRHRTPETHWPETCSNNVAGWVTVKPDFFMFPLSSPGTAQCLTCRRCPIYALGTCLFGSDVTCSNGTESCFHGEARKLTTAL